MHGIMEWVALLGLYALVFVVAWYGKRKLDRAERKTFWVLYAFWSITIFVANYVGSLIGVLSFLPWVNNALHTFVWIGICLTWLFLAVREEHMVLQFLAFSLFSLVVRYGEFNLFGVWDHPDFLGVFPGTHAYIVGWSFVDGLYPIITFLLLKLLARWIDGLIVRPDLEAYLERAGL